MHACIHKRAGMERDREWRMGSKGDEARKWGRVGREGRGVSEM